MLGGLLAVSLTLAGCGNGKNPQVLQEQTSITGLNTDVTPTFFIRNAYVTPSVAGRQLVPAGQPLVLNMYVFNNGDLPDRITGFLAAGTTPVQLSAPIIVPAHNFVVIGPSGHHVAWPSQRSVFVGGYVTATVQFANAGSRPLVLPVVDATTNLS